MKKVSDLRGWPPPWKGSVAGVDIPRPPDAEVVLKGATTRGTAVVLKVKLNDRELTGVLILSTTDQARDAAAALQDGIGSTIDRAGELTIP